MCRIRSHVFVLCVVALMVQTTVGDAVFGPMGPYHHAGTSCANVFRSIKKSLAVTKEGDHVEVHPLYNEFQVDTCLNEGKPCGGLYGGLSSECRPISKSYANAYVRSIKENYSKWRMALIEVPGPCVCFVKTSSE